MDIYAIAIGLIGVAALAGLVICIHGLRKQIEELAAFVGHTRHTHKADDALEEITAKARRARWHSDQAQKLQAQLVEEMRQAQQNASDAETIALILRGDPTARAFERSLKAVIKPWEIKE